MPCVYPWYGKVTVELPVARRFTLIDLLFWVTFVALVLAFNVPIWRMIQRAGNLADMVQAVAASADGSTFAALLGDGKVLAWESSGTLKSTTQTNGILDGRLAVSRDGQFIAVVPHSEPGMSFGDVQVFDVVTSKLLKTIPTDVLGPALASSAAFSPIENLLAITHPDVTELYFLDDERPVSTITCGGAQPRFSPNGEMIAMAGYDGGIN